MINEEQPKRLTEQQLSNYWGISKNTLRKWRSNGDGPIYIKIGARIIYRLEDIEDFEIKRLYSSTSGKINKEVK